MKFFWIRFVYSGLIFSDTKGFTIEKSTLQKTRKPVINGTIEFSHEILKTEVILKRTENVIIRSLYRDGKNNELLWNCHHPKSLAEIIYDKKSYKGFGYAETLFSQVKPWNLPIEELRWGRFLSDSYTVIMQFMKMIILFSVIVLIILNSPRFSSSGRVSFPDYFSK